MNTISGRVVLKETGAGIPDVLVVIYDIDPGTQPEEVIRPTPTRALSSEDASDGDPTNSVLTAAEVISSTPAPARSLPPQAAGGGDRLGSVLTARDGSFELSYEDTEFQIRKPNERRPDLFLQVLAPEEPDQAAESSVLYVSRRNRQNAGKIEQYLIRIPADRLTLAGIELPSLLPPEVEPAQGRVRRLQDDRARSAAILDGTLAVARERVDTHRTRFAGFSEKLQAALSTALSSVPANVLQPERLVRPGESPFTKNSAVIQQNIRDIVNSDDPSKRALARGFISLTQAEVEALRAQVVDGTIPESAVREVAAQNGAQGPTTFLQRTDLLPLCRPPTPGTDECLSALDDSQPGGPILARDANDPNTGDQPITPDDIPRFLGRLTEPMTAPEEQLLVGLTPTATLDRIQRSVQDLLFQPSPADVPAFHDFHQLQIAFQHVWQELIDSGVLDLAHDAYETIVELGGDPNRPEYETSDPFQAIATEAQFALRAVHLAPPPSVGDDTDDDTEYYAARGRSLNSVNGTDARRRRPRPSRVIVIRRPPGPRPPRDEGETEAVDPAARLPALLSALEARRREKYAFTIFAANAKERSINFGILNAFRQMWTPLSYQAGPLVKSIPLAPKQTQKIVVSRKVTKKRFQKELENNLRVTKEEMSQTSRAEQEIAKRASAKTEFSHSNTASGGVQYGVFNASGTSTTTFKHDATKSTDDVKKSFHESVFKSAQEFKHERTTEITTETLEELETTETTEISNPNDEIAVTYLFYELERRYRLHERLFRVTPVVLVAQEVPAPHEIDQDWLVAHDWILNRVILDDSFLPTLETLVESAGAATAIDQLGANVSQQRQIVAELRDELRIARRAADRQSNLLLDTVGKQTGDGGGGLFGVVDSVVDAAGDLLFGDSPDANQANRETLRDSAEAAANRVRDLTFRLEREVTALNSITETYAKALQAHHTHLTEIARLCVHVKENILHYMQGIWRYEPPDQRFFRLHNVPIPTLQPEQRRFRIDLDNPTSAPITQPHQALDRFGGRQAQTFAVETLCQFSEPEQLEFKPLCEVADLDNLLGFKGNYMLFPLFESNPLTDYMMEPYVDRATGELVDPSDPAGWSLDEFSQYVCCLKEQLTADEFESLKPQLKQLYKDILTAPRRNDDVLVVPTDSLFIEALPAAHSLIEEFKAAHRMIDVKKVQGEVRKLELENVRYAARILANEREDPDIDKKVIIEGTPSPVVEP